MTYFDHIRELSDEDLAYFIDSLNPDIEVLMLAMKQTLDGRGRRDRWDEGASSTLTGTRIYMYQTLKKDFDERLREIECERNPNWP